MVGFVYFESVRSEEMKSSWMKGTIILTASAFLVKFLSLLYKVPYQNIAGDEGLYAFQQVYPFIGIYTTLNGVVLPAIISELLLTYEFSDDIKRYIKQSLWGFGAVSFLMLFIGSDLLAKLMGDPQLASQIKVIGFIFLLLPSLSYWRGVAQTKPETIQYAAYSITLEQLFRVVAIIGAVFIMAGKSSYVTAHWAYLGGLIGPIIAIVFLALCPVKDKTVSAMKLTHRPHFFKKSVYLFLSAGILILFQLIDSLFIFNALQTSEIVLDSLSSNNDTMMHLAGETAMALKGSYDRGLPIVQTATVFTGAVVSAMLPQLAVEQDEKKRKKLFNESLHYILLLAVPATLGLLYVVGDLNIALFENNNGIEAIRILVLQVLLYPFIVFSTTVLQREGKYSHLLISILAGLSLKILLVGPLTTSLSIEGAAISSVVGLAGIAFLNICFFKKLFSKRLIGTCIQITIATSSMWLALDFSEPLVASFMTNIGDVRLESLINLGMKAGIGGLTYGAVMGIFMLLRQAVKGGRQKKQRKKVQKSKK